MDSETTSSTASRRATILILTAAVGGGHEAAARALQEELEPAGYRVIVTDGIRPMSRIMQWNLHTGYAHLLMVSPTALGLFFWMSTNRPGAAVTRFLVSRTCADRLLEAIEPFKPDLVVSTYPFITAALGYLRDRGKLHVPAVALIDDFGVHRLWVASGVDQHMVVSARSAALARRAGGRARLTNIPVAPAFSTTPSRSEAREALGLPAKAPIALIIGGAWGIGNIEGAVTSALDAGWFPVVVSGSNNELQERLERQFPWPDQARILGWTDQIPQLMAAADCLIQNAGGMTCLEAISQRLPILMYKPIPGHGVLNARVMEESGIARQVDSDRELRDILRRARTGELELMPPIPEASDSATKVIEELLTQPIPTKRSRRPALSRTRLVVALAPMLGLLVRTGWKRRRQRQEDDRESPPMPSA